MAVIVIELTPRPSLRVWGTVRDAEGRPFAGAQVSVSALGGGCGVQLDVMREGHRRQELRITESGEIRVEMKKF